MVNRLRIIRRHLLPSRRLSLYVMGVFLIQFFIILMVLVAILQSLDLLNRSGEIVEATGTRAALFTYIKWRLSELISQFVPFAVLLAALFSVFSLAKNSEVTVMRAAGLAPVQVLVPLILGGALIALGHFMFHDAVTVGSSHRLHVWQASDYASTVPLNDDSRTDVWLSDGDQVIEARFASRMAEQVILDDVTIYTKGEDGLVSRSMAGEFAIHDGRMWTLYNVRRFDLDRHDLTMVESLPWQLGLPNEQIFAYAGRPEHTRLGMLANDIDILKKAGSETFTLRTNWHHRIAQAMSSIMMPFIAIFVGFGLPRKGALVGRVILGMALGFSYFVVDNYLTAMGSMGIMPPVMAAYTTLAVFILTATSFLLRLR